MTNWKPDTSFTFLKKRAELLAVIRQFFSDRHILEVETPLLSRATVTDPFIESIQAYVKAPDMKNPETLYLQTSPEFAMKRLLAAGSGPIYQISKAFRQGDLSPLHQPEFTILEWYRPGFNHHDLMDELDLLQQQLFNTPKAIKISYKEAFQHNLNIDPHVDADEKLIQALYDHEVVFMPFPGIDRNFYLNLLLTYCIEPYFNKNIPTFLYDFPVSQAALAKIRYENTGAVASRFELYYKGIELANGFHELQEEAEQRQRFEKDLLYRKNHQLNEVPLDENFLAALSQGLPDCAGVAVGLDRIFMCACHLSTINEAITFAFRKNS